MIKSLLITIVLILVVCVHLLAQTDSLANLDEQDADLKFNYYSLILPPTLISLGAISVESDWAEHKMQQIRDGLQKNIDRKITIDDFTQYAPMTTVYALNLCGLRGKK